MFLSNISWCSANEKDTESTAVIFRSGSSELVYDRPKSLSPEKTDWMTKNAQTAIPITKEANRLINLTVLNRVVAIL
jgi:hypothetical protein